MNLSEYQSRILQAVESENSLLVEALAGTGKSTLLLLVAKRLKELSFSNSLCHFVVFGKKNKEDLAEKFKNIDWEDSVKTLHSLCLSIVKKAYPRIVVDTEKYRKIAVNQGILTSRQNGDKIPGKLLVSVKDKKKGTTKLNDLSSESEFPRFLDLCRLYCLCNLMGNRIRINSDEAGKLIEDQGLEIFNVIKIVGFAEQVLTEGLFNAINWIDFTDMAWLLQVEHEPEISLALESFKERCQILSIDEAQDTDPLQIEVLRKLRGISTKFLAVGDRYQAVYAFRGCLADGLDKIQQIFDCETYPLPINYRCPVKHIKLVRSTFSHIKIEAHTDAIEGNISILSDDEQTVETLKTLPYKDCLMISRKNAILVKYALKFLSKGIPAKVKDRDLSTRIKTLLIKVLGTNVYHYETFPNLIESYLTSELIRLRDHPNPSLSDGLSDLCEAINALWDAYPNDLKKWEGWDKVLGQIFGEKDNTVHLLSIHTAKGAEAPNVFLLDFESLPFHHPKMNETQIQQEDNLLYVALTRSKNNLFLVYSDNQHPLPWWAELDTSFFSDEEEEIDPVVHNLVKLFSDLTAEQKDWFLNIVGAEIL